MYEDGQLVGVLASHVDDLITCGTGKKYQDSMTKLTDVIHLKKKEGTFRFCGKNVVQEPGGNVSLEQVDAIECLEYQTLDKNRRKAPSLSLTEAEKSDFRALIGSLGWITRQTRPDVMVNVSMASQTMGNPKIQDVVALNKAVKMLKETADFKWNFVKSEITLENAVVFMHADSSFANAEGGKSQCGYVIGLATEAMKDGEESPVLVLEAVSASIKRVCRSTLAAEANAFLMGVESAAYLSSLLREMMNPDVSLRNLEQEYPKKPIIAFTDAKSLESTINKDAGQPSDKRVKLLVAQVREVIDEECSVVWIDTSQMLADVLTKIGCERDLILDVLSRGRWKLLPSKEAEEKKMNIRAGRQRRKLEKKAEQLAAEQPKSSEDGCKTPMM